MDAHFLESLLKGFSGLKTLQYSLQDDYHTEDDRPLNNFTPAEFVQAAECQAATLEHLEISLTNNVIATSTVSALGNAWEQDGSLRIFEKLNFLAIDAHRLVSMNDLPQNISTLVLRNVYGRYGEGCVVDTATVIGNLIAMDGSLPKLQHVFVYAEDRDFDAYYLSDEYCALYNEDLDGLRFQVFPNFAVYEEDRDGLRYQIFPKLGYQLYCCYVPWSDEDEKEDYDEIASAQYWKLDKLVR
jgi:hypothetical protein